MTYDVIWSGSATTYGERGELLPPRPQHDHDHLMAAAISRHGIETAPYRPNGRLTPAERERAKQLAREGVPIKQIREALGWKYDREAVRNVVRQDRKWWREQHEQADGPTG